MQTVMTTNNAYDCVLLVDDNDRVVSRWDVDMSVLESYLLYGYDADKWHVDQWPSGFDPEMEEDEAIADDLRTIGCYGNEVGRNGQIEDPKRREFWGIWSPGVQNMMLDSGMKNRIDAAAVILGLPEDRK